MSVLKVLKYGDETLRNPAEKVSKVSAKIQKLVSDMFDTMYAYNGAGLAAPQIGVSKRILVMDCSTEEKPLPAMSFINPVLIKKEGEFISEEGCLSFPGMTTAVTRYSQISVRYTDVKGKTQLLSVTSEENDYLCKAIQHEMDHLDGILFIDLVIDRFSAKALLEANNLPAIDPSG